MSEQEKPKRKHGGARANAGRKIVPEVGAFVYMQITLPATMRDFAKQQPGGASAYIRRLIEADRYLTKLEEFPEIA